MDAVQIIDLIGRGGVLTMLVLALITGVRGDWVFGREHRSMETDLRRQLTEKDERIAEMETDLRAWQRAAFDSLQVSRQASSVADRATSLAAPPPGATFPPVLVDEKRR